MNATKWLERDHDLILEALRVLGAVATWTQGGGTVAVESLKKLHAFFHEFADEYHHSKEEQVLFPALLAAGMPESGPVAVMLREHNLGRKLLQSIERSLPNLDVDAAFSYVDLLSSHIRKENSILFQMANRMLVHQDEELMAQMQARTEQTAAHVLDLDQYRRMLDEVLASCRH